MAFKDFFLGLVRELLDAALAIPLAMARAVKRRVVLPVMAFLGRKAPESEPLHPDKVVAGCYRWLAAWAKRRGKQRMPFETPLEHGRRLRGLPGLDEGLAQCVLDIVNSFMVYRYGAGPVSPEIAISAKRAREKLSSVRSTRWHAFRERKRG